MTIVGSWRVEIDIYGRKMNKLGLQNNRIKKVVVELLGFKVLFGLATRLQIKDYCLSLLKGGMMIQFLSIYPLVR